jgi:CelD/BcsL family acetyltransferase involved in cellulose biosynthesis
MAPRLYEDDLATAFPHREAEWTGSTTCESCHPDHYASWHRTFHRTMTQEATPETVLGAFDGRRLVFGFRDAAGRQVTARPSSSVPSGILILCRRPWPRSRFLS